MTFLPGESGNRVGRPSSSPVLKKQKQIRDLVMHCVPKAARLLERWLDNDADVETQRYAVKEILDRVYGKAPQSLQLGDNEGNSLSITVNVNTKAPPIDVTDSAQPRIMATSTRSITD